MISSMCTGFTYLSVVTGILLNLIFEADLLRDSVKVSQGSNPKLMHGSD